MITKGTLTMEDGSKHRLTALMSDRIRGKQLVRKLDLTGDPMADYVAAAYYASQRSGLIDGKTDFWEWADTVQDFDLDLSIEAIDRAAVNGSLDPDVAAMMRAYYAPEETTEDTETDDTARAGESTATPLG